MVRIFSSGTSNGQAPVNYLLSNNDYQGNERDSSPEVLEGIPRATIDIINASSNLKHKYVSGVIAFRDNEKPTRAQMHEVIASFKSTVCPGLSQDKFNSLFVLHQDKGNTEIHFVFPMMLSNGKRHNIHPPGPCNLEIFKRFVECTNQELGYSQVVIADPFKVQLSNFKLKSPDFKNDQRKLDALKQSIHKAIVKGEINDRPGLCEWLSEELGCSITRQGSDYISVKLPGDKKAQRLKGGMFNENANYRVMLETSRKNKVHVMLTSTEYQTSKARLEKLVEERNAFNTTTYIQSNRPMRLGGVKPATAQIINKTNEEKPMSNAPSFIAMKRMIDDAFGRMVQAQAPNLSTNKINSLQGVKDRLESRRSMTSASGTSSGPTAFDAVNSIKMALSSLGSSIDSARGELASAKTHSEIAQATSKLQALLFQQQALLAQLGNAELAQKNAKPKFKT